MVGATLVALVAIASPVRADDSPANPDLARARAALDRLEYNDALEALDKALRRGGNSPEAVAEIYRLEGEVAAALGREGEAVKSFERLLTLDPDARLGSGVSPKIVEPFREARSRVAAREPLKVRCEVDRGPPAKVSIVSQSDPLEMVRGMVALRAGKAEPLSPGDEDPFTLVLPPDARAKLVAAADEFGNQLWRSPIADCTDATFTGQPAVTIREPKPARRPLYEHWGLWAGVALVTGALGTYFGLEASSTVDELERMNADSSNHEFADAEELEDRARRNALWANIAFAAAGASAVAATILYLRRSRGHTERAAVLTPAAGSDSVGVTLVLPF